MLFPIIKVRDKDCGSVHIVGTSSHDVLAVVAGNIVYRNLQNGCETGEDGEYEFLGREEWESLEIEFVPFEELRELHEMHTRNELARQSARRGLLDAVDDVADDE